MRTETEVDKREILAVWIKGLDDNVVQDHAVLSESI